MSPDVQAKTIEACAKAVHAASQRIWEEAEAAAGHDAAERLKAKGYPIEYQQVAAEQAAREAYGERTALVWEVFKKPGRWLGRWELGPAFPDGRLSREERERAGEQGSLIVHPADTEQSIANQLASLLDARTESV